MPNFCALTQASRVNRAWTIAGACTPLEGRLRNIMAEFERAWSDIAVKPQWRIDEEISASKWNVQVVSDDDNKLKW